MSLSDLLLRIRPLVERELEPLSPPYTLFFSLCDGSQRAEIFHLTGNNIERLWKTAAGKSQRIARKARNRICWLRIDWVLTSEEVSLPELTARLHGTKRNYFRYGVSLDPGHKLSFLEQELNGNAILYGGQQVDHAVFNEKNFQIYARKRYGKNLEIDFSKQESVHILSTQGAFCSAGEGPLLLHPSGPDAGRREIDSLDRKDVFKLIDNSSQYLAGQVKPSGQFIYGWHPCFDRSIDTYNSLRHASSTYAMVEAWEVTGDDQLKSAIDRSLKYLTEKLIREVTTDNGERLAFLVDQGNEIKLGGNAVCLLALVKYSEVTGNRKYLPLLRRLALGIRYMQDPYSGRFVHVLQYPALDIKEDFRIIYYDGEAAFGLMRLYGLTRDSLWLEMVEKAFEHFIAAEHWKAHDHWLSYCVNELTLHRPEKRYYRFGIQNFIGHLDFVLERITTFPTLLELMMAAEQMIIRIGRQPEFQGLLEQLDTGKFYQALHHRAHYLLNGHFWPEHAMYFMNPRRILHSFFIRHQAFRVRIDDVEHYLSGFIAYRKYLARCDESARQQEPVGTLEPDPVPAGPVVAWGGDVNLGRRQHYRTATLGEEQPLGKLPPLNGADLTIVNLECVVATTGEQGVAKGEGGPYYYRARPEMLRVLTSANIDMVTTANNHAGDYGPAALMEQRHWLDAVGIGHTGSGANLEEALAPAIRPAGELNVAVFSLDTTQRRFAATRDRPGIAGLPSADPEAWKALLAPRIAAARERAHIVLVAAHWGKNGETEPADEETALGHAIIDAGADAVLGASAHILQGVEIYRERPIIHDAGDLLFDSVRSRPVDSGIFRLELSSDGITQVFFHPVGVSFGYTQLQTGRPAIEATRRFAEKCSRLGTDLKITEGGSGTLGLSPPERPKLRCERAAATQFNTGAIESNTILFNAAYMPGKVPEEYRIAPEKIGPLTLTGLHIHPGEIRSRRMLWVETYWTVERPLSEDIRIDIRAVPTVKTRMPTWGLSMDHDPCDWQIPTSRWKPGEIYRDYYGLRPPHIDLLENTDLQLEIRCLSSDITSVPFVPENTPVRINIPGKPDKRNASAPTTYRSKFPETIHHYRDGQTWNAEQLAAVTGGQWITPPPKDWFVNSIVVGKRHIGLNKPPVLFVAHERADRARHEQYTSKSDENWDLHQTLHRICGNISGAIVSKPVTGLPGDFPVLQVADPIKATIELGLAARQRYRNHVVAITGTTGKSTTVSMAKWILGRHSHVLSSIDNYNSRVGVPVTLASLSPEHEAAIIEVAQSALWMNRGPITRLLKPTIALITEIGLSQTSAGIRSTKDVAKWKSRIFDGLNGPSIAIFGDHLEHFDFVMEQAEKYAERTIIFGTSKKSELRILKVDRERWGSRVTLQIPDRKLTFHVPSPGMGMVRNAVAAIAIAYAMGEDLSAGARRLEDWQNDEGRLQKYSIRLSDRRIEVIDDSWNSEVSSMLNAFSVLSGTETRNGGRKIAALGRIVHLGNQAQALHESLSQPLVDTGMHHVITQGDEMKYLRAKLPENLLGPHFDNAPELVTYLEGLLKDSDLLLIKGSRRDSDFGDIPKLLAAIGEKTGASLSYEETGQ